MNVNYDDMFDLQPSCREIRVLVAAVLAIADATDADRTVILVAHSLGHPFDYAFDIVLVDGVMDDEVADDEDDGGDDASRVFRIPRHRMRVCEIVSAIIIKKIK